MVHHIVLVLPTRYQYAVVVSPLSEPCFLSVKHNNTKSFRIVVMAIEQRTVSGFHSVISSVMSSQGTELLMKQYGQKAHGFEQSHAMDIAMHMRSFAAIAAEIGVPVSQTKGHYIEKNGHPGKVNLVEVVSPAGADLRVSFGDPNTTNEEVLTDISQYLDLFRTVWDAGFPISLDPPPANFCKDATGTMWYVDTMPPRQKLEDGSVISEWPTPPEQSRDFIDQRYFTPMQARVIYPQLLRAIEGRDILFDRIKFAIGIHLGMEAFRLIDITGDQRERLLSAPNPQDVDLLRIIAAEEKHKGSLSHEDFHEIYHLTHIGIGGILPDQDDITTAARLLTQDQQYALYA